MSDIFPMLGYQVGVGGAGGFIVGYAVKKISKLMAVLGGLIMIGLLYLATSGIISINFEALWNAVNNALGLAGSAFSWLISMIALLPFAGSFVAGFLLGLKMG